MRPAAAVQLLLILVTMQAGNSLPIIQVKHLFHVFLQTQHHYESKDLALGKHYAAPLLKWCPGICLVSSRRGEGCVSLKKKKAGKFNAFFFQSSRYTSAFRVPRIKLAEIENSDRSCSLKTFLRNIFH